MNDPKTNFLTGMKHGWPIGVGYFAVSFALGIAARNAGFSWLQAGVMSALFHASAGEYAAIRMVALNAMLLEAVIMEAIANARYMLMSFSLSQKLSEKIPTGHRLIMANFITDEIFALCIGTPKELKPSYMYGIASVASPGWVFGTVLGVIMGNILPARAVSALSVALFGMFLAIIVPPAKKNHILLLFVTLAMAASGLFSVLPLTAGISGGIRTIVLTVVFSLTAAILFPRED